MKKYKLGELLEVSRGMSLSGKYFSTKGDLMRLTLGNFDYNNNCFKDDKSKNNLFYIGKVKPEFILNKGDIITPLTEQAIGLLGSTAKIPCDNKYIHSQDVGLIKCSEKLNPNFAFYLISSQLVKNQLSVTAQQTKIRHTSPSKIKDCIVWIPDYPQQQKIGRILSSIDDKIAINNQINAILERVARAIYEYYFVQFDFPNQQGKPYKSSGGAMRFDSTLNRPIPKDFEVKKLADIIIKNTKKAKKDNKKSLIDLSVMPQNTFCLNLNNIGDAFNTNLFEMQKFDILFGSIRPYLKKAGFAPFDGLVTGTIHSIKPINPNFFNFILLTLTHKSFFDYAVSVSKGTKMPIIGYEELSDFKIPFNESVVEKFNTILNFKEIISNNIIQNQKLKNLRDFLLPLLINAQVQI